MILILAEFPIEKTPITVPPRTCGCGHVMTEIPGGKWSFYAPCDGLYYDCRCGSTHCMPIDEAEAALAAMEAEAA